MNRWGVTNKRIKATLGAVFISVICNNFREDFFWSAVGAHLTEEVQLKARLPFVFHIKLDPLARTAQDMFI